MSSSLLGNVNSIKIEDLFKLNLSIPIYQRPYSWNSEQVIALIEDIIEAFDKKKDKYLIGNMILYKKENDIEIVDGQQRITTLSLILNTLNMSVGFLENEINDLSFKLIKDNNKIINTKLEYYKKKDALKEYILKSVIITYINAKDLDEAFMLFDSQNTRGKPLSRIDLLKVHHIRFIENNLKQKEVAKSWEKTIKQKNMYDITFVLNNLMIIRKALRGELVGDDLVYLDLFKEFKAEDDIPKLNNYNQPPIFENFDYDIVNKELTLVSKSFNLRGMFKIDNGLEFLPFEIIQSIEGGERFFWFILKYTELVNGIEEKNEVFNLLNNLYGNGNIFLKKIYQSSLIFFIDKFGIEDIEDFAIRIFIVLFYLRYKKHQIRKEAVIKFNWNDNTKLDIYKIIMIKYSSKLVIKEIDRYIAFNIDKIEIKNIKGTKQVFWDTFSKYNHKISNILGDKYVK